MTKELESKNEELHKTFLLIHNEALYHEGGFLVASRGIKMPKPSITVAQMAKEWRCTPRHASKVKQGIARVTCNQDCKCPLATATAALATKQTQTIAELNA